MTELEWCQTNDSEGLVRYLCGAKASPRKIRLLNCAWFRRIWASLQNDVYRHTVEVVEQFADGLATSEELVAAREAALVALNQALDASQTEWRVSGIGYFPPEAVQWAAELDAMVGIAAEVVARPDPYACTALILQKFETAVLEEQGRRGRPRHEKAGQQNRRSKIRRSQSELARHVFANPFRSYQGPPAWPSTVVQLSQALYDGTSCRLPLSDALEEAGYADLGEHFRSEEWHPKGCWVLDVILAKG